MRSSTHSLFLLGVLLASSMIGEATYFEPRKNILYSQHYRAFADAIWVAPSAPRFLFSAANETSSISIDLEFTPYYNVTQTLIPGGLLEVIVLHQDDYDALGISYEGSKLVCCDPMLYDGGYCTDVGAAIFRGMPKIRDSFLRVAFPFVLGSSQSIRVRADLYPTASGVHWLFLANCLDYTSESVFVSGSYALTNPYGKLPADHWGSGVLFTGLVLGYGAFLLLWTVLLLRMRDYAHPMHCAPLLVAMLGLLESSMLLHNLFFFNDTGDGDARLILFASLCGAAKRALSLALLVLLGMGYPIARTPSRSFVIVSCVCCSLVYAGFSSFTQTINNWGEFMSSYTIPSTYIFATVVPLAMVSALLFGWVIVTHLNTLRMLPHPASSQAPHKFRAQFRIIALTGFLMVVFSLVETISYYRTAVYVVYWPYWWCWEGSWQVFFFVPFVALAWIWRPSKNTPQMVYASPRPSAEDSSDDDDDNNNNNHDNDNDSSGNHNNNSGSDELSTSGGGLINRDEHDSADDLQNGDHRVLLPSDDEEYDPDEGLLAFRLG